MSQLLRDSLNNCKSIINNPNQIKYLKLALVDLTNGNYLGNGSSIKIPSINIPELSSAENLLNLILEKSHIQLSPNEITAILNQTKNLEFVNQFNIQGDFNWDIDENNAYIGKKNKKLLESILRGSAENQPIDNIDYNKYSLYTVAAIALIRQVFMNIKGNDIEAQKAFLDSSKEIVKYYDKNYIKDHQTPLPLEEKAELANAKIAYGSKDIKVAIEMMVNQAEYLAQQDGTLKSNENFTNREELILNIWKNATEPAVQKAFMIMSFLSATMGIPTIYGGDELGMSGYEEKAKNVTLQNRNALIWSELENGPFKNYRTKIQNMMNKAMQIRSKDGLQALNKGTAYEIKTSDNNIPALLMQDAYGNMTISIFNATDINTNPKFNYFEYFKINDKNKENFFNENDIESINKDNPYVPIQQTKNLDYLELAEGLSLPIGLTFINSDIKDKASYIIEKFENKYRLVKKGGGKISLKNNVMILKHVAFKGNNKNINKQYIINQNIYKNINNMSENHKFSIVST